MEQGLDWGRILLAVLLTGCMLLLPAAVCWWDLRTDIRRFGSDAAARPVRYAPGGQRYRGGMAIRDRAGDEIGRRDEIGRSDEAAVRAEAAVR
jgi:hypothetical protein